MFRGGESAVPSMLSHMEVIRDIDIPDIITKVIVGIEKGDPIITSFQCELIKVGNYSGKSRNSFVHFSPVGIAFQANSIASGITTAYAIPLDCIIKMYQCLKLHPYFIVLVNDTFANILHDTMEFRTNNAKMKQYYFEPNSEELSHKYITFRLSERSIEHRAQLIHQFYYGKIIDTSDHVSRDKLYLKVTQSENMNIVVEIEDDSDEEPEYLSQTGCTTFICTFETTGQCTQAKVNSVQCHPDTIIHNFDRSDGAYGGDDIRELQSLTTTQDAFKKIKKTVFLEVPSANELVFKYPKDDEGKLNKIAIQVRDIACLELDTWLNDNIIDFGCKQIYLEQLSADDQKRSYIFSSLFYPSYLKMYSKLKHSFFDIWEKPDIAFTESIAPWTEDINLFEKDFIFVPICDDDHWVLAVICYPGLVLKNYQKKKKLIGQIIQRYKRRRLEELLNSLNPNCASDSSSERTTSIDSRIDPHYSSSEPDCGSTVENSINDLDKEKRPCIIILDSLLDTFSRKRIFKVLRTYLQQEWNLRNPIALEFSKLAMPGLFLSVPQQNNFSDCGLYILEFLKLFFLKPIESFKPPLPDKRDWISDLEARLLRLNMFNDILLYLWKHCPDKVHLVPKMQLYQ